jgi:uncharacterized protein YbjT (DUF2867 family)
MFESKSANEGVRVLLVGAGGQVGRRVHELLRLACHSVKAATGRDLTVPGAAAGLAEGCDVVMSCAGASVSMGAPDKRGYLDVDPVIHEQLLAETLRAKAYRFVYLGVHTEEGYTHTAYVRAHEKFVVALRRSALSATVIRPTGIFSAFEDLMPMARKGFCPLIGNGLARTNPIDPQDVAELMVRYVAAGPTDLPCGGPEVLTRRQINEIVAQAAGKPGAWMPKAPAGFVRMEARVVRLFHPRVADLMEFFSEVATQDCIAPALGKRRMAEYFGVVPARLAVQAT